jgi:hypothetical protein
MSDKKYILWVDSPNIVRYLYILAMKRTLSSAFGSHHLFSRNSRPNIQLKTANTLQEALEFITNNRDSCIGIVSEMMLETGKQFCSDPRANMGITSGLLLLDELNRLGLVIPLIFVTNCTDEIMQSLQINNLACCYKPQYPPKELSDFVFVSFISRLSL